MILCLLQSQLADVDDKELTSMDKKITELQEKATAAKSKVKSMEASKSSDFSITKIVCVG